MKRNRVHFACLHLQPREFKRLERHGKVSFDMDVSRLVVRNAGTLERVKVKARAGYRRSKTVILWLEKRQD